MAEFERDLLIERTQAGLKRAKAEGKVLGRPTSLSVEQQAHVRARRTQGASLGVLAKELGVSRSAIHRAESPLVSNAPAGSPSHASTAVHVAQLITADGLAV